MRLACICPSPALDHTMVVPSLAVDGAVRASASLTTAGGKAANVARFARGFGAQVTLVALLGEDGADLYSALAARDGLELAAVVVPGLAVRVCPVLVDPAGGTVLLVSDCPPSVDEAVWSKFVERSASAAAAADVACVSGSFPWVPGIDPASSLLEALGTSTPVWVDTSGPALAAAWPAPGVALKVNLEEAGELLGRGDRDESEARDRTVAAASALGGGCDVVVTAGRAGAASATEAGLRWQDAPAVEARNATASGDAFMAAYLCAGRGELAEARDPLRAGVAAGAANAGAWWPAAPTASVLGLLSTMGQGLQMPRDGRVTVGEATPSSRLARDARMGHLDA